jgi:hypothetical protein
LAKNTAAPNPFEEEPQFKLTKEQKKAAKGISKDEARFMVDAYYSMQKYRMTTDHQVRALTESGEPTMLIGDIRNQFNNSETVLGKILDGYSETQSVGRWARSIIGLGPINTAALLVHIDIEQAPTVGHVWSFAGLNPSAKWGKSQKRPWNARLKVVCWKIGESFVKVQNNGDDIYGKIYANRKLLETERNEQLAFADQAKAALAAKKFGVDTVARQFYEAGKLPPARIHLRATRYAVKLFLSHLHEAMYVDRYGTLPPKPYVLDHLGHAHKIEAPNKHLIDGWDSL